ncbi:MAG: 2-oxoglutarate dehydrogenase complex dihydrolipoyllysine-residue succinyltransferase [Alphaproteobacteria bacterium]|nr:2-oxoglutarate dehydrogenase complex dihydrolipoyllysine-residue succinyltransferase [Alphaproteobacteria bacterium]MDX5368808.1 2-oxoglutarate dehydrogenase complex dihydrolipoyllysine-residue succinyltransferase [Alphaproteobacteria bacterium]MDX5463536.1 2-oxoglutarate dehydrogenase complex dihydrolipoyllysine-residue succinyltransferase [Alphaproteobacteria bacterium]
MAVEIRVPQMGESVTEGTVATWAKKPGDRVEQDELLVEIETDKVTMEVNAPAAGVLGEIVANEGDVVEIGALLGTIEEGGAAAAKPAAKAEAPKSEKPAPKAESKPQAPARSDVEDAPSAKKLMAEAGLDRTQVEGTGRDGRVMKGDVLAAVEKLRESGGKEPKAGKPAAPSGPRAEGDREERVRMTRLRQTIARRLKDAQDTAAMLTTFNEVDLTEVMALRNEWKDLFEKKHGVKLGFMSFFVKACIHALKEVPSVNAEIDGTDLVYKNYYHIGVAVGTDQGLVVPVVRDADAMSFAGIEQEINRLGRAARDGKLKLDDMQGGTFTISNGGVYGSLMSTPILNPPQSGILGMHKIQERPMVVNGEIKIRPMMYLALSYDHRIIDGKEAVTFLVRVKDCLEDPRRMLLDL